MRRLADANRIQRFMKELGRAARCDITVYLAGGATAVLKGWRPTTIDVDIKMVPERDEVLRAMPNLKQSLELNIELASPRIVSKCGRVIRQSVRRSLIRHEESKPRERAEVECTDHNPCTAETCESDDPRFCVFTLLPHGVPCAVPDDRGSPSVPFAADALSQLRKSAARMNLAMLAEERK